MADAERPIDVEHASHGPEGTTRPEIIRFRAPSFTAARIERVAGRLKTGSDAWCLAIIDAALAEAERQARADDVAAGIRLYQVVIEDRSFDGASIALDQKATSPDAALVAAATGFCRVRLSSIRRRPPAGWRVRLTVEVDGEEHCLWIT